MWPSLPPLFWLALLAGGLLLAAAAWRRGLRWRPAGVLRLGLLGLALLAALLPETRAVAPVPPARSVLIVDQSDSISPEDRAFARAQSRQWLFEGDNRLVIVVGEAVVPYAAAAFPEVGGRATDLAGALDLAGDFLGNEPGSIVIATDGLPSDPLAAADAVQRLAGLGHTLSIIPLDENAFPTDVFAGPIYLPSAMWEHTPFTAILPVFVRLPGDVELLVSVNEQLVLEETINLAAGQHLVPINLQTSVSEIMTIAAEVRALGDPRPENNTAYAALRVFPAPRVLVVTGNASTAGALARALAQSGLDADLMSPADLPDSLTALSIYQVILVDNILASSLSEAQMRTLKDFVQQLGRGLVMTGGRNAFTLGGYKDTLLEPILPVRLEPPPREQNSPLTLVLVLDRSASMDGVRGTPPHLRPISLAREAALRSVETLGPEDYLGILSYNTSPAWSLPIQLAGEGDVLQTAKNAMASLTPSGGTAIFAALDAAIAGLLETQTSETRHIVLLSDGNDDTPLSDYAALAEFALEQGITISTIALGIEADQELMALVAQAGQGRFYAVLQAVDLPKILIDESQAARDENVHEGRVAAVAGEQGHPVLSGFDPGSLPPLLGYNALESKAADGAEDVLLAADFEDPLLSVWQYGLGRVAVWTGDLGQEWSADWSAWEGWGRFWSNVIRYTLPDPASGPGQVEISVGPLEVRLAARVLNGAGVPRNAVPVSFSVVESGGQVRSYAVPQTGPGLYELSIPRPPDGVYRGVVEYLDEAGAPVEIAAALVVNYVSEWQPALTPQRFSVGAVSGWSELLPPGPPAESAALEPNQVVQRLALALLLLWPLEIAIRRRRMPWK